MPLFWQLQRVILQCSDTTILFTNFILAILLPFYFIGESLFDQDTKADLTLLSYMKELGMLTHYKTW